MVKMEPHRDADHQTVALVVGEAERGLEPVARVAREQPLLDGRPDGHCDPRAQQEQRHDQRQLRPGHQAA
jgi:hypothetical protein